MLAWSSFILVSESYPKEWKEKEKISPQTYSELTFTILEPVFYHGIWEQKIFLRAAVGKENILE